MASLPPPAKRARPKPPAAAAAAALPWDGAPALNTQLERMREPARTFFAQLAAPAALVPDANGFLALPVHPSLGASGGKRFETSRENARAVVPLLSRELAQTYMDAMLNRCDEDLHNYLYIHGAAGAGKSYALYEAVCRLMARRDDVRVAYMHDCAGWDDEVVGAVKEMAAIVATAFDPESERGMWDVCASVQTGDALKDLLGSTIPDYCAEKQLKFLFVFDQHNGLTPPLRERSPWSMPEKFLLALNTWKRLGATVISASANNDYFLKVATWPAMKRVDWYSGFTDAEADRWRRHYGFFLADADGWADAKALLSNWPLELNILRERMEPTLAERLEKLTNERTDVFGLHDDNHLTARVNEDRKRSAYAGLIVDMLLARPGVLTRYTGTSALINKQLMYYDEPSTMVRPIHELARRFYLMQGYLRPGGLLNSTVEDILVNPAATGDSKGRAIESYVICCMEEKAAFVLEAKLCKNINKALANAAPVFDSSARPLVRYNFGSQKVPGDIPWHRNLLLVPLNPNYPGVDVLLWDVQTRTLVGAQFTVRARPHKMSFTPALERAWRAASGAEVFRFVWAAPSAASTSITRGQYLVTLDALRTLCAPLLAHYVP